MSDSPPRLATHDDAVAAAHRVAAALAPGTIERDRAGASVVPADALAALAPLDSSGLLAITVPAAYGGPELGPTTLAEVIRVVAAVDPAIAQAPQAHYLLVDVLTVWGSVPQRKRLLDDVLAGRRLGNALAERGGKHAQDLSTRLAPADDGRLLLRGRKYYCTGALTASWIAVSALDAAARGSLAVAGAKAFGSEVAVEAGSELFALCGASAADERWDLHRHWRNARTHSVHDPADWKYHHIGAYELGDVLPTNHGQL
jgi:alkylation response protein AidB-like acyl-CoA dehydrogenase